MIFKKKVIEHKMYVSSSAQLWTEIFFILRGIEQDTIKNIY